MSISIDNIAEKIIANNIDKHEALLSFERLSEDEKAQLVEKLKGLENHNASNNKNLQVLPLLESVDERNLTEAQQAYINKLVGEFETFAPKSKENAQAGQKYLVDQRKTANLKKCMKGLQFHLTYTKAEGAYLYDLDGNKYVDITGDNGVNIFGHQPKFINQAIEKQSERGFPLVGYTEDLFKTAELFCEITDHERMLFTQSGTEAVMWAIRIARAATGKKKIVIFEGSYHGLSDTVLAIKGQRGESLALGLGMMQEFAEQLIVLDYGNMDQLSIIEDNADEIAGVLVEPIQSRHPYIQPLAFLQELRKLTIEKQMPLIFDEMITGFRACHRGAQGYFNIKADIATYGKIPGGGMPTGMIAGAAKYMDLADGGTFNFDDDSMPNMKRTLMAGTHTRNPMKIATTLAILTEIKKRCTGKLNSDNCGCFQKDLNEKTRLMAVKINKHFVDKNLPIIIDQFSSLFKIRFTDGSHGLTRELLLCLMRMNGLETSVSGNFFLTTAHSDKDIQTIIDVITKSADTLLNEGFFSPKEIVEIVLPQSIDQSNSDIAETVEFNSQNNVSNHLDEIEQLKRLIKSDLQNFQEGVI
ncbi:aminotransferase class III-fold pyridoxal phosphate-dependent enzyme [Colwelliaceae bacterium 6441]